MYMGSNLHSNLIDFCATVSYLSFFGWYFHTRT